MKHSEECYTCDIDGCDEVVDRYGFTYNLLKPSIHGNVALDFIMLTEHNDEVHVCRDCQITVMKLHIYKLTKLGMKS